MLTISNSKHGDQHCHCGLLGKKLSHTYSPEIHAFWGDYSYSLFEKSEKDLERFLKTGKWTRLNVTIPYKKTVFSFMDTLGKEALETESINTIIKKDDGSLHGENTDVYGFIEMVKHSGIVLDGKKILVLGSGGASSAVCCALRTMDLDYVIISRRGENRYDNIEKHRDGEIIINTTPLGMYPDNGETPVDLSLFPHCSGVLDLIYNPARTPLLLQAENLGIPCKNGLYMLVAQAKKSAEFFTGKTVSFEKTDEIYHVLSRKMQNIVLIGMPGCGKTTFAKKLGKLTGRVVYDSDEAITLKFGCSPAELIRTQGEVAFRKMETGILKTLGKNSSAIIATGGGVVTHDENYPLLHQNSIIVWLKRSPENLPTENRPLSQTKSPNQLYAERVDSYQKFSDLIIDLDQTPSHESLITIMKTEII